ncbi:hypothetical protein UAJ10_15655 [Nitrospirillum sp. BR 11164]|uniref:hypothetical protein n=1 Tax=Nitrospirillum sp. BR 11164 TaxID=3104324 RepID=UPI002AFF8A37|nr:hypothetical protein [Nitrospirillum sp. BR 11164]MEA1650440.1 hypothetical protein [Nitrospirillum sp. BR 11164]
MMGGDEEQQKAILLNLSLHQAFKDKLKAYQDGKTSVARRLAAVCALDDGSSAVVVSNATP